MKLDEARALYQLCIPLFESFNDHIGNANCHQRLGDIALRKSEYERSKEHFDVALSLYRRTGSERGRANCIQGMGDIAGFKGDYSEAERMYDQALPIFRLVGDMRGEATCLTCLGDIALERKDSEQARARHEEALGVYYKIPDYLLIGQAHVALAGLLEDDKGERQRHAQGAFAAWSRIGRRDGSSVFWCEHPGISGPSYWARAVFPGIRTYPRKIRRDLIGGLVQLFGRLIEKPSQTKH